MQNALAETGFGTNRSGTDRGDSPWPDTEWPGTGRRDTKRPCQRRPWLRPDLQRLSQHQQRTARRRKPRCAAMSRAWIKSATTEAGASKGDKGTLADALVASDAELGSAAPTRLRRKARRRGQTRPTTLAPHGPRPRPSPCPAEERAASIKSDPEPEAAADKGTGTAVHLEAQRRRPVRPGPSARGLVKVGLDSQVTAQGDAPNAAGNLPRENQHLGRADGHDRGRSPARLQDASGEQAGAGSQGSETEYPSRNRIRLRPAAPARQPPP